MSGLEPVLLFSVLGGAVGALGELQQGQANQDAAQAEADQADANRIISNQERVQNMRTAQVEASDKRRENTRTLASMRAAFGASGGDLMGSPIEVLEDAASEMSLDEARLRDEGRARNREGGIEMLQADRDKAFALMKKRNAKKAAGISAFSTLLGGVTGGLSRTG